MTLFARPLRNGNCGICEAEAVISPEAVVFGVGRRPDQEVAYVIAPVVRAPGDGARSFPALRITFPKSGYYRADGSFLLVKGLHGDSKSTFCDLMNEIGTVWLFNVTRRFQLSIK